MAYVPLSGLTGSCVPRTRTVVATEPMVRGADSAETGTGIDPAAAPSATQAPVTPSTSPASRVSVEILLFMRIPPPDSRSTGPPTSWADPHPR